MKQGMLTGKMTSRQRFLSAARCQPVDRPPVWVMRQAGRYLPEYRALKAKHGFLEMVRTPELATTITLQPIQRFGLDAAILFSDILVVPEALGQPYDFRDGGGIEMKYAVETADQIARLETNAIEERLQYIPAALKLIRKELGDERALLGFAGSPWTLATYMVEGGSSQTFSKIKSLYYSNPSVFRELMEKITAAVTSLLRMQIEAGADAVQIFDSWAAACPAQHYYEMSLRWISRIIANLPSETPVIVFAKGMTHHHEDLARTGAQVLGVDWATDLRTLADRLPADMAVQGNLDPQLMNEPPETVHQETHALLEAMRGRVGHIVNLGHGIQPTARIESMQELVNTVRSFH